MAARKSTSKPAAGSAVAVIPTDTGASGPVDVVVPPKTLGKLEKVVEINALRGAGLWRIAADALLEIKTRKLWRKAKDADGNAYPNFVTYAEERFGFKKTYAYDLVKAATRKPEALTEGGARAEMTADRQPSALDAWQAAERITKAYTSFEDRTGDLRDRAISNETFVAAYDDMVRQMGTLVRAFTARFPRPIEGTAEEVESNEEDTD